MGVGAYTEMGTYSDTTVHVLNVLNDLSMHMVIKSVCGLFYSNTRCYN